MALDEVTQICPSPCRPGSPTPRKGIQIITVAHAKRSCAPVGRDGAHVIMDTSGAKIWLPGISDPAALDPLSPVRHAAMREHGEDRHPPPVMART